MPGPIRRQGMFASNVNVHADPPMGRRSYRANFDGAEESGCKTVAVLNALSAPVYLLSLEDII